MRVVGCSSRGSDPQFRPVAPSSAAERSRSFVASDPAQYRRSASGRAKLNNLAAGPPARRCHAVRDASPPNAPDVSVLIPSFGRPDKLSRCLGSLARQPGAREGAFETIVGLDGGNEDEAETIQRAHHAALGGRLRVIALARSGYIPVRRRLFEIARGSIALSLNDDVTLEPGVIDTHRRAHVSASGPAVVAAGRAHWKPVESPTLFDALVQRSPLIFFDPDSASRDEHGRLSYRYCYGLNMSVGVEAVRRVGGIRGPGFAYGYDDTELAHRLVTEADAVVVDAAHAVVVHDHRYTPEAVLRREYELGRSAWAYAAESPAFALDLFRRDIRSSDERAYSRAYLQRERGDAERIERSVCSLGAKPSDHVHEDMLSVLAEHWTVLKRYLWRWGLLDASAGVPARWSLLSEGGPLP
ncbi:MAG: glycosyltransferase [Planctomycetota bacterium]